MCGIAGIYTTNDSLDLAVLSAMAQRLHHRGPDEAGVHQDGVLGLAHTRLSIIDLAGGHQPLFAQGGNLVLVANGEIYNFIELRAELEARGHLFSTHSDCETILHAYAEYGMDFLSHLCGMFAFALYDKTANRLILARDRLGMKPLFVTESAAGLAFASEIKGLLPVLGQPAVKSEALLQYLQNQFCTGRDTLFQGVERVLPGEAWCVEQGKVVRRWKYWTELDVTPRELTSAQAMEEFDGLMETVMRQHMRSDVPFGLFLSGGVDSTTLLALLSRYKNEPIRTFSVGFPQSRLGDELSTAETLARHYGSQHTVLRPDGQAMLQRLPYSVWAADELMRDFANLPTSLLAQEAGRELKVVFSGEGGDEAFAGYGRYRPLGAERWIKNLLWPGSGGFRTSGNFDGWGSKLFGDELMALGKSWRQPVIDAWKAAPRGWSDLQRRQYVDLVTALPDNLMVKADRMLMAWGVEGRVPFLDHRVVEFGLALPDALKVEGKQGKAFLKHWAARFLPVEHLYARKRGFSVPVGEWLNGEYLERLGKVLAGNAAIRAWFRVEGVTALVQRQRDKGDVSKNLIALLQFAIWHRLFIEGDGSAPAVMQDPVALLE